MTFFGEADPLKVVQNTETLKRERARQKAATKASARFTAAAVPLLAFGGLFEGGSLLKPADVVERTAALGLLGCGAALLVVGFVKRIAYLRSHPSDA